MNFDYTYIILFKLIVFEPVTILTNLFIASYCLYAFLKINPLKKTLAHHWARFFLFIGTSSIIGSIAHGVHFQLGSAFLNTTIFLMNAISLIAIYHCFKAANIYFSIGRKGPSKYTTWLVIGWIVVLLIFTFLQNNFLLIKIHAGIVLTYSLIIHLITYKKTGSPYIAWGIIISFLSIIIHSLKLSISEWFNYKDIAHVIMLISLICIYKGVKIKMFEPLNDVSKGV